MLNPIQVHYHLSITAQLFALLDRPEVQLALQARIGILNDTVHLGIPASSTWSEILQSPRLRAKILELDPSFADSWTSVVLQLCTPPPPDCCECVCKGGGSGGGVGASVWLCECVCV
jgi:hypothetical protein